MRIDSFSLTGFLAICLIMINGCGPVDEEARREQAKKVLADLRFSIDLNGTHIPDVVAGDPMPETTGNDIDGNPVNLSDYSGKVLLLSFWGGG